MIAVALALVPRFAFGVALQPSFYHRTFHERAEAAAAAAVPPGVTVEATNYLGPHLSGRDTVLLWDGDGTTPRFSPWVVADVTAPGVHLALQAGRAAAGRAAEEARLPGDLPAGRVPRPARPGGSP